MNQWGVSKEHSDRAGCQWLTARRPDGIGLSPAGDLPSPVSQSLTLCVTGQKQPWQSPKKRGRQDLGTTQLLIAPMLCPHLTGDFYVGVAFFCCLGFLHDMAVIVPVYMEDRAGPWWLLMPCLCLKRHLCPR